MNSQIHNPPPVGIETIWTDEVRPKDSTTDMTYDKTFTHKYTVTPEGVKNTTGIDLVAEAGNLVAAQRKCTKASNAVYAYIKTRYVHNDDRAVRSMEHKLANQPDSYMILRDAQIAYVEADFLFNVGLLKSWTGINPETGQVTELKGKSFPESAMDVLQQGGLLSRARIGEVVTDLMYRTEY
jgi:hypothetical protein